MFMPAGFYPFAGKFQYCLALLDYMEIYTPTGQIPQ